MSGSQIMPAENPPPNIKTKPPDFSFNIREGGRGGFNIRGKRLNCARPGRPDSSNSFLQRLPKHFAPTVQSLAKPTPQLHAGESKVRNTEGVNTASHDIG